MHYFGASLQRSQIAYPALNLSLSHCGALLTLHSIACHLPLLHSKLHNGALQRSQITTSSGPVNFFRHCRQTGLLLVYRGPVTVNHNTIKFNNLIFLIIVKIYLFFKVRNMQKCVFTHCFHTGHDISLFKSKLNKSPY